MYAGRVSSAVELWPAFEDAENSDASLRYEVVGDSNPELFSSVQIDPATGRLTLAYAIGVREPVSVMVETFGTGTVPDRELEAAIRKTFDLTPGGIIQALNLRNPVYRATASYGHFGRKPESRDVHGRRVDLFTWESASRVAELKDAVRRVA